MRWVFIFLLLPSTFLFAANPATVVSDWMALGSGCRGDANSGDMKILVLPDSKNPQRIEVQFDMGSYSLSGDKPIQKQNQDFARECALRFAFQVPPNTRLKSVEVNSDFNVRQDKGVHSEIHSRLVSANGSLGEWERHFDSSKAVKEEAIEMRLIPHEEGKKILKNSECGMPKILGADFTFENHRNSFQEKVEMKHSKNQVRFFIDLETCL